jgi:hypothetical protein
MGEARSHLLELIQTAHKINIPSDVNATPQEQEQELNLVSQLALPALSATL